MSPVLFLIYTSVYIGLIATSFYVLGYQSEKKKKKQLFTDEELPKVSIVIPAWNEEKSIKRSINDLFASNYPSEKLEIIVVDNNSKDNTVSIIKSLKQKYKKLKIYSEKKQGKGYALNHGINKSSGEVVFTMDADSFVEPQCVKEMTRYFKNPEVMSVTPSMLIYKPKGVLQRIQQAEYLFGLFIRKAFTSINAIYVTPGAFSAYRKSFFDKYGGYDTTTLSEDLEIALRIQYNGYVIENSPESSVYTIAPNTFKTLLIQRRRWYTGLVKITWKYRKIISPKYGDLGLFIIPISWISIFLAVFVFNYMLADILISIKDELLFMAKINFDFSSLYGINAYILERMIFRIASHPVIIFALFFIVVLGAYMRFATKKVGKTKGLPSTVLLYFLLFSIMFGFFWTVSIIYVALNKKVTWR